jgi:hypothetical protein
VGPLGKSATNWPTVIAPGDYEDQGFGGMMTGRGNRNNRRKSAPFPLSPPQIPHELTGCEPGPSRWEARDLEGSWGDIIFHSGANNCK